MTGREKKQIANGTKKPKGEIKPQMESTKPKLKLQAKIAGKGWVDVTAPTSQKLIDGVRRQRGYKYQVVQA